MLRVKGTKRIFKNYLQGLTSSSLKESLYLPVPEKSDVYGYVACPQTVLR